MPRATVDGAQLGHVAAKAGGNCSGEVGRGRGVERDTMLELATLTLARSGANSEYARTRKWSRDTYFPLDRRCSTRGLKAEGH